MRQRRIAVTSILTLLFFLLAIGTVSAQTSTPAPTPTPAPTSTPAPTPAQETYVVQAGDNLFRIAIRFGTTYQILAAENGITNPRLIYVGQSLRIPARTGGTAPAPTNTAAPVVATATPLPSSGATDTVRAGDTLGRIAARNNTTVAALLAVNPNITNANIVYVGQVINLPATGTTPPAQATAEATAQVTPVVSVPATVGETLPPNTFGYGVEVFVDGQPIAEIVEKIDQLDVQWVKIVVSWRDLEVTKGQIVYGELDNAISSLDAIDVNILLTLTNAPSWARDSQDENGPPKDLADFNTFVTAIATHYKGVVDAYEIWNEPNLRRNWNCDRRMCDTDYVELLRGASQALTTTDDAAIVISAGLAPTRFNDRVNAINDRVYMESILSRGGATLVDAVGAHPGGWANPPDSTCCQQPIGVSTHFEDEVFYFKNNIEAYRALMVKYNISNKPLWVTKFGWGSSEDTSPPSQINIFVTYTSLTEQAIYVPRAYEIGDSLNYVGPMFLDNLNGCQSSAGQALVELCYTSLIAPNGSARPVFNTVQSINKTGGTTSTTTTTTTTTTDTSSMEVVPVATVEATLPVNP
jgi:LysM repeat protein